MKFRLPAIVFCIGLGWLSAAAAVQSPSPLSASAPVRLKELAHIDGVRDNALVGYGLVVGLAGTGDTDRGGATMQSIANALIRFGVRVTPDEITSRNVAAVIVTTTLPPFANAGDKLDVNVASMGDARSLVGGTLMLAPLRGADDKVYALAQGPLSVGGFRYDAFGNVVQKNHPTVGQVPGGATIEATVATSVVSTAGNLYVVLSDPDYTTAGRVADAINSRLPPLDDGGETRARAVDAGRIVVHLTPSERADLVHVIGRIEDSQISPDQTARVVVNERTGTVVSGGDVRLGAVTVTHGELKVTVSTDYLVSQPIVIGDAGSSVRTAIVPQADLKVDEGTKAAVSLPAGTSVSDLVFALNKIKVSPRDMISILEAIKRAGSLRAELIIQ
jgi:flagellar P-ring protein precursor FlgI